MRFRALITSRTPSAVFSDHASRRSRKQVFIESIGRNHKTEKARLQADLDRDVKVLATIDAATT
ncbi:hypothetical protein SHKM778_31390 [Streptomyces sp. KM77-8]|uniref:Transposase n=1 Tax=Streptomyces haneummycinicus TaxID=3074435 RepID=A0AAT9HH49_9ACTN